MKLIFAIVFLAIFVFLPAFAACQPCQKTAGLPELVGQSGLVALAFRKDAAQDEQYERGPEFIEVKVQEIFKGDGTVKVGDRLKVRSWYGECPYGVHMDRFTSALLFLNVEKDRGGFFSEPTYEAATYGQALCNDAAMPLNGRDLQIWDPIVRKKKKYPFELFKQQFLGVAR